MKAFRDILVYVKLIPDPTGSKIQSPQMTGFLDLFRSNKQALQNALTGLIKGNITGACINSEKDQKEKHLDQKCKHTLYMWLKRASRKGNVITQHAQNQRRKNLEKENHFNLQIYST